MIGYLPDGILRAVEDLERADVLVLVPVLVFELMAAQERETARQSDGQEEEERKRESE